MAVGSVDNDLVGQLWSDEPATVDLLAAKAIAATVADAVLDDALDPISLGLSGTWGSGKTTVLELVSTELDVLGHEVGGGVGVAEGENLRA